MARVLLERNSYSVTFNTPRHSRHSLIHHQRLPLEKIWQPLESVALWKRVESDYELLHSYNGIPLTNKPWLVTFEVYLPYLEEEKVLFFQKIIRQRLLADNCRKIIAMSDYAKLRFIKKLSNWPLLERVINKLEVIHPNLPLLASRPKTYSKNDTLNLVFVGNSFARKGGIVVLRMASKAQKLGLPIHIHIVSSLRFGHSVTDHQNIELYQNDLKLLDLPNVTFHKTIKNQQVIQLFSQSHFHILPTLYDTYGYSVIESFSVGTPVITTNVAALPEFVRPQENGYLLQIPLSEYRTWHHFYKQVAKNSDEYWEILDSTFNDWSDKLLDMIRDFLERSDQSEHYEYLSSGAINQIKSVHESGKVNDLLDNIYSEALKETN